MTRLEAQTYFTKFDVAIDSTDKYLRCFKCQKKLSYSKIVATINGQTQVIFEGYRCSKDHRYTFTNLVYTHAEFVGSVLKAIKDGNVCNT